MIAILEEQIRPRSTYQMCRWVEGAPIIMSRTRRGITTLWRLSLPREVKPGYWIQRPRKLTDPIDQRDAFDELVRCGYDPVAIDRELGKRIKERRRAGK